MPDTRIIVITGATRGLGRAMAREFARRGHVVAGCGRSAEGIAALRDELAAPHRFDTVDVSDDGQVASWAMRIVESFGAPRLLLNNAGVINRSAPLWRVPAAEFSGVIDTNVKGTVNVLRHFLPTMVARRAGVIVNFSSGWGRRADAGVAPYCASKFAIEGLTQALAQELPAGMAAVALNPGAIATDMLRGFSGGDASGYPTPAAWATAAVPFLLKLGPADNGQSVRAPRV